MDETPSDICVWLAAAAVDAERAGEPLTERMGMSELLVNLFKFNVWTMSQPHVGAKKANSKRPIRLISAAAAANVNTRTSTAAPE